MPGMLASKTQFTSKEQELQPAHRSIHSPRGGQVWENVAKRISHHSPAGVKGLVLTNWLICCAFIIADSTNYFL
jgi:hypothetical protein